MRIVFQDLTESQFNSLLNRESNLNNRIRIGHGLADIHIFQRNRQGQGFIGDIFSKLGSKVIPFIKELIFPATKSLARNIASDIASGENFKKSLKRRSLETVAEVASKIMKGRGTKRGRSVKKLAPRKRVKTRRKGKNKRKKPLNMVRRKRPKKRCQGSLKCSKDIFG